MAKPPAGFHTPRPSSLRSTPAAVARTSAGSSSSSSDPTLPGPTSIRRLDLSSSTAKAVVTSTANRTSVVGSSSSASATDLPAPTSRDLASVAKVVAKRLAYDDDGGFTFPTAAATLPEEGDLATLLELPDPDDASSSTVISDAMAVSADSTVAEVAAPADSTADSEQGPIPRTEMDLVLAELSGARGLSPRSKRLVAALVEVAAAELSPSPTATALRLRRAAFWGKVRVGVLAATVFAVAAMDVALVVALIGGRRGNGQYHVLPPT